MPARAKEATQQGKNKAPGAIVWSVISIMALIVVLSLFYVLINYQFGTQEAEVALLAPLWAMSGVFTPLVLLVELELFKTIKLPNNSIADFVYLILPIISILFLILSILSFLMQGQYVASISFDLVGFSINISAAVLIFCFLIYYSKRRGWLNKPRGRPPGPKKRRK